MKAVYSLVAAASIATLSFGARSDNFEVAVATPVIAADIIEADLLAAEVLSTSPGQAINPTAATAGSTKQAAFAAFADGMSTMGVLASGGVELNPIMPTSPIGILMVTAAKMGIAKWADSMPDEQRTSTLSSMSATFGGAAVNNLLVLVAGSNPITLVGGLLAGAYFWNDTQEKLKTEAEVKAAYYRAKAAEHHKAVMLAWNEDKEKRATMQASLAVRDLGMLAHDGQAAPGAGQQVVTASLGALPTAKQVVVPNYQVKTADIVRPATPAGAQLAAGVVASAELAQQLDMPSGLSLAPGLTAEALQPITLPRSVAALPGATSQPSPAPSAPATNALSWMPQI